MKIEARLLGLDRRQSQGPSPTQDGRDPDSSEQTSTSSPNHMNREFPGDSEREGESPAESPSNGRGPFTRFEDSLEEKVSDANEPIDEDCKIYHPTHFDRLEDRKILQDILASLRASQAPHTGLQASLTSCIAEYRARLGAFHPDDFLGMIREMEITIEGTTPLMLEMYRAELLRHGDATIVLVSELLEVALKIAYLKEMDRARIEQEAGQFTALLQYLADI